MQRQRKNPMKPIASLLAACLLSSLPLAAARACPVDGVVIAPGTLLAVKPPGAAVVVLGAAQLAILPRQERVQRRTVAAGAASSATADVELSLRYGGVLLRDVLEQAVAPALKSRSARGLVVEAIATDGYRAIFSWGELFNSTAAEQVLVIDALDGRPLGAEQGPLALRALADLRTGPRHVRNLCALVLRSPTP
jgi:hypothetical protein